MTHTKQTSKKTTGGPARCGKLPNLKKVIGPASTTQVITNFIPKVKFVPCASSIPELDVQKDDIPKDVPKPLFHNIYCIFVGMAVNCTAASNVYAQCANTALSFQRNLRRCHESHSSGDKNGATMPYFGFKTANNVLVLNVPTTICAPMEVSSWSQICSGPLLILHFILKTLEHFGSCGRVMRNVLQPFMPEDNLQYHEVIFDIGMPEEAIKHAWLMKTLVKQVKHLEHTVCGDMWGGFEGEESGRRKRTNVSVQDKPIAYTIDDFFTGLFVSGIEDYVKGANLWMLACGHMLREVKAFNPFKACVRYYEFEHAFAFGAEKFHTCLTASFITAYVERVLVEGFELQEVIRDLLAASPRLGLHSSITHLHVEHAFHRRQHTILEYNKGLKCVSGEVSMTVSTYIFFHESNRPFGKTLPYQCAGCYYGTSSTQSLLPFMPFMDRLLAVFAHVLNPSGPDQIGDETGVELTCRNQLPPGALKFEQFQCAAL
ncbi:hypothetical protein EDB19DRAFT_1828687 [Suillus lakei]|nr:hypothetical protein EDB19DRAFT_1828687 [Suillus lakei]